MNKFVPAPAAAAVGVKTTFDDTALIGRLTTFEYLISETLFAKSTFAQAPLILICVAPTGNAISFVGTSPLMVITPVAVVTTNGLNKILPKIALSLKLKPFNNAFAGARAMATPTALLPLTEVRQGF